MIDIHCHILPGLDDGPRTLDESITMAELALKDGARTVVATPHMLNGMHENGLEKIEKTLSDLKQAISGRGLLLRLLIGGDVHLAPGMASAVRNGLAVTIGDMGKYILVELPFFGIPPAVKEEVFQLKLQGITPIITHPERHALILRDPSLLEDLVDLGCLAQVTAASLTGGFGEAARRGAETLIKRRLIHLIASDAHSPVDRPPGLSRAVRAAASILGSLDEAERMVTETPAAVLAGEPIRP